MAVVEYRVVGCRVEGCRVEGCRVEGCRVVGCRESQRGVTLIETLAALLILSFVVVSTLGLFSHGMKLNATGADYTVLVNLAKDKVESLLSLDYEHADLTPEVAHAEVLTSLEVSISWEVAEHRVDQDADDTGPAFGTDPLTSTAAGNGNLKVILVKLVSNTQYGLGRRTMTVQAIKTLG